MLQVRPRKDFEMLFECMTRGSVNSVSLSLQQTWLLCFAEPCKVEASKSLRNVSESTNALQNQAYLIAAQLTGSIAIGWKPWTKVLYAAKSIDPASPRKDLTNIRHGS